MTHEIITEPDGTQHGTDGIVTVTLQGEGRMFKRRAVKAAGTENAYEVSFLVTEINGVRVYQSGHDVIVTTQDLYP